MLEKTNVMRILDKLHIPYRPHSYAHTSAVSGMDVAHALNQDVTHVFKTLVTVSKTMKYYVFLIPVAAELDLKKAAASVQEKSVSLIKSQQLLPLTGYIHGGCSPIGMKKQLPTVIHKTAAQQPTMIFSAGKIGYQVEITLENLQKVLDFDLADLI